MKKVVSMFVALAMAFTLGPVVPVRAENACEGENCQINDESERLWAWCKENPKDCAAYVGETLWDLTKISCGKAKDAIVGVAQAIRDHNYTQTWEDVKNHNYTQTWESIKNYNYTQTWENVKNYNYTQGFEMAKENVKWAASEVSDEWTYWTWLTSAGVGALTLGTWFLNLVTCCGCGRCRLRMP